MKIETAFSMMTLHWREAQKAKRERQRVEWEMMTPEKPWEWTRAIGKGGHVEHSSPGQFAVIREEEDGRLSMFVMYCFEECDRDFRVADIEQAKAWLQLSIQHGRLDGDFE